MLFQMNDPKAHMKHTKVTLGPGIPACSCGSDFEWEYEREDHMAYYELLALREASKGGYEVKKGCHEH